MPATLDHLAYPHLFGNVIDLLDFKTKLTIRLTSKHVKHLVDRVLFKHVQVYSTGCSAPNDESNDLGSTSSCHILIFSSTSRNEEQPPTLQIHHCYDNTHHPISAASSIFAHIETVDFMDRGPWPTDFTPNTLQDVKFIRGGSIDVDTGSKDIAATRVNTIDLCVTPVSIRFDPGRTPYVLDLGVGGYDSAAAKIVINIVYDASYLIECPHGIKNVQKRNRGNTIPELVITLHQQSERQRAPSSPPTAEELQAKSKASARLLQNLIAAVCHSRFGHLTLVGTLMGKVGLQDGLYRLAQRRLDKETADNKVPCGRSAREFVSLCSFDEYEAKVGSEAFCMETGWNL